MFICGLLALGCAPRQAQVRQPYYGPTETMSEVVHAINRNNRQLPTLWASVARNGFEASFVDDRGRRQHVVLGGNVLYRAPRDVRVVGRHDVAGEVLQIGSNDEIYWLMGKDPGPDTAWWGRYKFLGADCAQPIPIRPDLVLEVLGVGLINDDFTQLPTPVMRFNHDEDAYMFLWNVRLPDRWVAVKEVWYDRITKRPRFVLLFDEHGRVVLRAFLSQHEPVEVPEVPRQDWPTVATNYRLYFPETHSSLRLQLEDVALSRRGLPSDLSFRFNPERAGVSTVIQLDKDCGP